MMYDLFVADNTKNALLNLEARENGFPKINAIRPAPLVHQIEYTINNISPFPCCVGFDGNIAGPNNCTFKINKLELKPKSYETKLAI
mmetsp:Transcript_3091/g.8383  ORF Transcript_3091/g.8383 Transcript_3091/m.8383 type:complete len:87 (-) Transcript_3091:22-282(-)